MIRTLLLASTVMLAGTAFAPTARAQGGLDFGIVQQELDFQSRFYPWAWQGSMWAAQQTPDHVPLGIDASSISAATQRWNDSFSGYAQQWHDNGYRTHDAMQRWSDAYRGYGTYQGGYGGPSYLLPYGPDAYHIDRGGYIYPGEMPGYSLYPRYR